MSVGQIEPTDITELVEIHHQSFQGYINTCIGRNYTYGFFDWFLNYPNSVTVKAFSDKGIVGYVVGAKIGYNAELNKRLKPLAIKGVLSNPSVLLHKNFLFILKSRIKALLSTSKNNTEPIEPNGKGLSLVGIGVLPSEAGKGYGKDLMKAFEEKAIELGYDYLRLSVYKSNERAKALYSKQGWKSVETPIPILYFYKELINSN
jgi:ribosomal protein S18 acetylase RimI-like enzyme